MARPRQHPAISILKRFAKAHNELRLLKLLNWQSITKGSVWEGTTDEAFAELMIASDSVIKAAERLRDAMLKAKATT